MDCVYKVGGAGALGDRLPADLNGVIVTPVARPRPARALSAAGTYIVSTVYVRGRKLRLHLHFDEDGGFWVNTPDLKGLVTQGETTDDAVANGVDAAIALLEARAKTSARPVRR